jgi:hypothetical protein
MRVGGELISTHYPSVPEHVLAAGIATLILEQHSRLPEANILAAGFASLVMLGLFIAYCFRLATFLRNKSASGQRLEWLNWAVFPVTLVLTFSSTATHWPATIRFHFSKSSFDELITQAYRGQKPEGFPRRVGLYWIDDVMDDNFQYESGQGTIGFVTGEALVDPCGLLYDKSNPESSGYLTTRIAPQWYVTEW